MEQNHSLQSLKKQHNNKPSESQQPTADPQYELNDKKMLLVTTYLLHRITTAKVYIVIDNMYLAIDKMYPNINNRCMIQGHTKHITY